MPWTTTNTAKGDNKLYSDARGVVPSLDLRFASQKNLNDYMTGQNLITFSRPVGVNQSPGTYVDENGIIQLSSADTPRFDHDPTTGESLGLLIEESRTNLVTYSEQFEDVSWGRAGTTSVTPNAAIAPDGSMTADQISLLSINSRISKFDLITTPGQAGTASIYIKNIDHVGSLTLRTNIVGGSAYNKFITLSNEWQRYDLTTVHNGTDNIGITIRETTSNPSGSFLVWGAQVEAGSFPTSYIPTTGTALIRSADVAEITGTNFSSWYNQSEGTTYLDFSRPFAPISSKYWYSFSGSNVITQRHSVYQPVNLAVVATTNDGTTQVTLSIAGSFSNKHAYAYKLNDYAACVDGGTVGTDTTATVPAIVKLNIGSFGNGFEQPNGTISRLTYFPDRLPDATLQAITA